MNQKELVDFILGNSKAAAYSKMTKPLTGILTKLGVKLQKYSKFKAYSDSGLNGYITSAEKFSFRRGAKPQAILYGLL